MSELAGPEAGLNIRPDNLDGSKARGGADHQLPTQRVFQGGLPGSGTSDHRYGGHPLEKPGPEGLMPPPGEGDDSCSPFYDTAHQRRLHVGHEQAVTGTAPQW